MNCTLNALFTLALFAVSSGAATFNKIQQDMNPVDGAYDTGTWFWTNGANWKAGTDDPTLVPPPADGDEIRFYRDTSVTGGRGAWRACIDTVGATLALTNSPIVGNYNGENYGLFDSTYFTPVYQASPIPNTIPLNNVNFTPKTAATVELEAASAPTMTIASMFLNKENYLHFYMPLNVVGDFSVEGSGVTLFGPLSIGGSMQLNGRNDANTPIDVRHTLNAVDASLKRRVRMTLRGTATFTGAFSIADTTPSEANPGLRTFASVQGGSFSAPSVTVEGGIFEVQGLAPTSIAIGGDMSVGNATFTNGTEYSQVRFIFEVDGVTPIAVTSNLTLNTASTLAVDASAYTVPGGNDDVTLMAFAGYGYLTEFNVEDPGNVLPDGYTIQYLPSEIVMANYEKAPHAGTVLIVR